MSLGGAIARGNVLITTDLDPLNAGLAKGGRDVEKWGKDTGKRAAGGFAFGGKAMAGALVVGAAFKGVEALANQFGELTEQIDKTSKLAATLDMPTESLVGWQHAAELSGVGSEELSSALLRFRKDASGPMDQALAGLTTRLDATSDAQERTKILVEAFGKSGAKLAPMFADGAAGIAKMKEEAVRLGITFDAATGKQVEAANDAITKTKTSIKGIFQSTLIAFAPAVEKIANFATKIITSLRPVFDWIGRYLDTYYTLFTATFEAIGEAVSTAFASISDIGGDLFGWTAELPTIQEVIIATFRAIGTVAAYTWDVIKIGAAPVAVAIGALIEVLGQLLSAYRDTLGAIVTQAKEMPTALKIASPLLGALALVNPDKIAATGEKLEKIGKGIKTWGAGAVGSFGESAASFNKWLDNILVKKAKIEEPAKRPAVTPDGSLKSDKLELTGALSRGSKEAYSMVVRNQFREFMGKEDTNKQILKEAQKGNKLNEKGVKGIEKIAEELEDTDTF